MSTPVEEVKITIDDQQPEVKVYVNDPAKVVGGIEHPPEDGEAYVGADGTWKKGFLM